MLDPAQLLVDNVIEIRKIFADYGDLDVRIFGSSEELSLDSDVDVLINLDSSPTDGCIVCIRKPSRFVRKPFGDGPVRAEECSDVSMDLVLKLRSLLGCAVEVVDERGLKNFYPNTYSETLTRK